MTAVSARPLASAWQQRPLGECAQLVNGRAYSQDELLSSGTPVIRIQNLNGGDRWYYSDLVLPDEKYCSEGDLLFAWSASFGPYIWSGPRSIFHYHIWRVIPGDELDKAFAFHLLNWITERVKAASHGVAMLHMTKSGMEAWPIPLPPIGEQRRIAEVLDRAEALRTKRRAALAQLDTLTQSVFLDIHGRARETHDESAFLAIAQTTRGAFVNGPFGSDLLTTELTTVGVPVVYIRDIRDGEYKRVSESYVTAAKAEQLAVCAVRPGDVLIAKVGDPPGIAAIYPSGEPPAIVTQDVVRIRIAAEQVVPEYVVGYLNAEVGRRKIASVTVQGTRARFSLGDLKKLKIELPPLALQQEFASRIAAVEKLKSAQRASLAELDALFASLQHRAFRGEL